jgi:ubiquinone/menaquinone biosynthesis C-methylase UbiE
VTVPPSGNPAQSNELSMRERLLEVLAPSPGERILEVGCGTGYYALHVARDLLPAGSLEMLDAQPQLLEEAIRGAREQRLTNVAATLGDARYLPYEADEFDAVYLVAALGDAQDHDTAMREVARVVRPRGRVVVGELYGDPHRIGIPSLRASAQRAGLSVARSVDAGFASFTVLERERRLQAAPG